MLSLLLALFQKELYTPRAEFGRAESAFLCRQPQNEENCGDISQSGEASLKEEIRPWGEAQGSRVNSQCYSSHTASYHLGKRDGMDFFWVENLGRKIVGVKYLS